MCGRSCHRWGTPTFVLVRRSVGAKGHKPLTARDEIEFPSLPSRREFSRQEFSRQTGLVLCANLVVEFSRQTGLEI
jgi:hypothetical protein